MVIEKMSWPGSQSSRQCPEGRKMAKNVELSELDPYTKDFQVPSGSAGHGDLVRGGPDHWRKEIEARESAPGQCGRLLRNFIEKGRKETR